MVIVTVDSIIFIVIVNIDRNSHRYVKWIVIVIVIVNIDGDSKRGK